MLRTRTLAYLLTLGFSFGLVAAETPANARDERVAMAKKKKKKKKAKKTKVAAKAKAKEVKLTADQKKARVELMGPFTWGMSKDEVLAALSKQLDERYAEKIADTTDVYKQDKLRKEKAKEIKRVKKSWVAFEKGAKSGWDVSIVDQEFARGVDEAMLEYWENQGGKNQRRFFFFDDGSLYKMFVQIDTAQFEDESQREFSFFAGLMSDKLGASAVGPMPVQSTEDIWVRALDKTKLEAFAVVMADPTRLKAVYADRKERVEIKVEENSITKAVTEDPDGEGPNLDSNKDAVQGVIKGQ